MQTINRNPDENPDYQNLVDTMFALNCLLVYTRYTITFNRQGSVATLRLGKVVLIRTTHLNAITDELTRRYEAARLRLPI